MGRISTVQAFDTAQSHIARAKEREQQSLDRSSSMKELTAPSQAPAQYVLASDMKDDVAIRETIAKNASLANHVLSAQENILSQSQDIVQKIHELALSASNQTVSPDVAKHTLPEVQGLYDNLLQSLNTKFGNRTLLAGHQSLKPAFDAEGNFLGDEGKISIEVDRGLKMPINISGAKFILGQGITDGVDIIQTIKGLIVGLEQNDLDQIRGSLSVLRKATDQLSYGRTEIAGRQLEISRALETHSLNDIHRKDAISKIEEADPVKAFSDLARDQTVLRAALETNRKVLNEMPTDILFK